MAKIKVHELAKELELQSKDILSFLQEKGIEAKAAQSSLEEDAAALVRKSLGHKKQAPAAEKTEAPAPAAKEPVKTQEEAKPAANKAQESAAENKGQDETKKKKKIIKIYYHYMIKYQSMLKIIILNIPSPSHH